MRFSRASSSGGRPAWRSRKTWERDLNGRLQALLAEGFLIDVGLQIADGDVPIVMLEGFLYFQHGLIMEVAVAFERRGSEIRMVKSSYHAAFSEPHRAIFRYDNAHPHPGHADHMHKHVFDPPGAPEPGAVEWVGHDGWPTLFDVVRELEDWWETTGCRLPPAGR